MIVSLDEKTPIARFVTATNLGRQYDFLHTAFIVHASNVGFTLSHRFICELNFYAVQFLSAQPGMYRQNYNVQISDSKHQPPRWEEVQGFMDDFMGRLNNEFAAADPLDLAAYVLWRMNWIHPFAQGNGRTARALSYFVLCMKLNMWLPGAPIIPELIRGTRDEYVRLLEEADAAIKPDGTTNIAPLAAYLSALVKRQITTGANP